MPLPNSPLAAAVLDKAEAIAVLLDSRQRAALLPFVGRECSVSQAAKASAELPNTMRSRVKRWQALGLLQETQRVPHQKGSMQLYRASADAYFISHHDTPAVDLFALANDIYTPMIAGFLDSYVRSSQALSDQWGIRFERNGEKWLVQPAKSASDQCRPSDEDAPLALLSQQDIQLSLAQAKAMKQELLGVIQKYANQNVENSQVFSLILGIAQLG
jgi:hypothetical protein